MENEDRKYRCRLATTQMVKRGEITRWPCQVCGESRVEAHHVDYDNPRSIVWLCRKHHRDAHWVTLPLTWVRSPVRSRNRLIYEPAEALSRLNQEAQLDRWMEECVEINPLEMQRVYELFESWRLWARRMYRPKTQTWRSLSLQLQKKGFTEIPGPLHGTYLSGIKLL